MRLAVLIATSCVLAAGCGATDETRDGGAPKASQQAASAPEGSLEALWRAPGEDVAIVPGTSDFGPGLNRVAFLVIDRAARVISSPTARVWVARGLKQKPFERAVARNERIGVPGGEAGDFEELYVVHVKLPTPGTYWLLAEPVGAAKRIQAIGNLVVKARPAAPAVGEPAVPSRTPTARTAAQARRITTARPPDLELLRTSVADALRAKEPFVVTFATPLYCSSRTCGPVVDVVQAVARTHRRSGVRFIHVEIYEGNDPANGPNRWYREWKLPHEPYTFVVDRRGVIRARFEGAFSVRELDAAVRRVAR